MSDALETTDQLDALKTNTFSTRSGDFFRSHKVVIICLAVFVLLVVMVLATFFTARWYFSDKAAPGVAIGDHVVTGQNADELNATVEQVVADSTITITDDEGKNVEASLSDLGVQVDVEDTVQQLLAAKGDDEYARLNPFVTTKVQLEATRDPLALGEFLTEKLVEEDQQAVPATIAFDDANATFTVSEGKSGVAPKTQAVDELVDTLIADPGSQNTVTVEYNDVDPPVSNDTAKQAADEANKRLANDITVGNGSGKTFTIPHDQIANWIKPVTDPGAGTITFDYDEQGIKDFLAEQLPQQLNQQKVDQEDVVDTNGTVLLTTVKGVDGVNVADTSSVINSVVDALNKGTSANFTAPVDVTQFAVKQTVSHMRVVVDRSTQTATVYQDDQPIKTFNVCTGKPSTQSDLGTFVIYLRYNSTTMRGPGYVTPNVRWVSYYNGGEGFHAAPWNTTGIATGDPGSHGSHGCVNMYEADAKWIYDNVPAGSVVQVVGAMPSGPVR